LGIRPTSQFAFNAARAEMSTKPKSGGRTAELTEDMRKEIEDAFNVFDPENSGKMDVKELKVAMRALGFEPRKDEIKKMLASVAADKTGELTRDQFTELMASRLIEKDARDEIVKAFRLFDDDETGKITFDNLKRVAKELGETITDEELRDMIHEADLDGDGQVNEDEFHRIMKKTCLY